MMTTQSFFNQLREAEIETIARFIGQTPKETTRLAIYNQLEDRLVDAYAHMPKDELRAFEKELMRNAMATKEPIWGDISHDHHDEVDGFIIGYIDAWKSNEPEDDNGGQVIAQVVGALINGKPATHVVYFEADARNDKDAQDAIASCTNDINAKLTKSDKVQIRHTLDMNGSPNKTIRLQAFNSYGEPVMHLATITIPKGFLGLMLPQIAIAPNLTPELNDRVSKAVQDILNNHSV